MTSTIPLPVGWDNPQPHDFDVRWVATNPHPPRGAPSSKVGPSEELSLVFILPAARGGLRTPHRSAMIWFHDGEDRIGGHTSSDI